VPVCVGLVDDKEVIVIKMGIVEPAIAIPPEGLISAWNFFMEDIVEMMEGIA
jgi:hypothetical protein